MRIRRFRHFPRGGITVSDLRMIDADGHVLEQLAAAARGVRRVPGPAQWRHPDDRGRPGARRGVACRAHVPAAGRFAARPAPRGHGRRRHRHRGALPDHARARVGAGGRRRAHDGPGVQPLAARVLLGDPDAPHRRRARRAAGPGPRGQGDGALRQRPGLQGGDDPARAVHREQEAERPGLRPVLGRRRAARLPDRRPPVLVRRHAVERRDPARAAGRLRSAVATRASRSARASGTRST